MEISKPLVFISGKGGVGKSTIAASIACSLAKRGKKTLLVEFGDRSFFKSFFGVEEVAFKPTSILPNLEVALWDFKSALREYVSYYIRSNKIYDLFFENVVMQKLIQIAPALKELALLGKATSGLRSVGPKMHYDNIVVDSYSMGHHLALLRAPLGITRAIRKGPMGKHSEEIAKIIKNESLFQQVVVMKPEMLPIQEGLELRDALRKDFGIESLLVCNQMVDPPISHEKFLTLEEQEGGSARELIYYYKGIFQNQKEALELLSTEEYMKVPFYIKFDNELTLAKKLGERF